MNSEELIKEAIAYVEGLLGKDHGGHDTSHALRVYNNAMRIAADEPVCDITVVSLAAILHDVDDHKIFDSKNNDNCRAFLRDKGISEKMTEEICSVIDSVSFSRNRGRSPQTLEGMIVQDADRLDAIGAIGIARTFAYGGEHGRSIEDSVRHFHDKLLLIRDELNTDSAKAIAEGRHRFLEEYLSELDEEIRPER